MLPTEDQPNQGSTGSNLTGSMISMQNYSRRQFLENSLIAVGGLLALPRRSSAAILPGIETVVAPLITGEEKNAQPDLWALEVNFKPVRMIQVELTDQKTGKSGRQLVWYLAYRAVVRSTSGIADTVKGADRPIFVPELSFVVDGKKGPEVHPDRVLPVAQEAILKRERYKYKNTVEIVGPVPKITPDRAKTWFSLDGLATWTGIDPDLVNFKIYFSGFSNGYKVAAGPDGEEIVTRRTLVQSFWRPGDRFEQNEEEIRLKGEPEWIYR
jgi:hypothetical protein